MFYYLVGTKNDVILNLAFRNGVIVEGAAHKQVVNLIKLSNDTLK